MDRDLVETEAHGGFEGGRRYTSIDCDHGQRHRGADGNR
jgi:hypothetical protein